MIKASPRNRADKNVWKKNNKNYNCHCKAIADITPPHVSQFQKRSWLSISKIYLETKFCPNWRISVFWWPFWIQKCHHSTPKWSPYGAACLTPYKYPFPLKSFHFWIFNNLFWFYIGSHFENVKNKEHNFEWWSIFVSSFKRIRYTEWI